MKTWRTIRSETLNLGFEKTKAYDKNKQAYVEAYNWAQKLIASVIGGVLAKMTVDCRKTDIIQIFDLKDMAELEGETFISLAQTGIVDYYTGQPEGRVYITDNRYLHVPAGVEGTLNVYFNSMPESISVDSDNDTPCQLPDKWANTMPYLMANRLYLDDDASKAGYYWNLWVEMKDSILTKEKEADVGVIITEGIDIDGWCY